MPAAVQSAGSDFKTVSVCALTYVWKASCAACLYGSDLFAVLGHSYGLKVMRPVEGTVDGPVVRYLYGCPSFDGPVIVSLTELPVSQYFLASEILGRSADGHEGGCDGRK